MFDLEAVKRNHDLFSYIENDLGPANRSKKWLCPFHHEDTPSFGVSPDGVYFRCFGCGASGDVIDYVALRMGVRFCDAVKYLDGGHLDANKEEIAEMRLQREEQKRLRDEARRIEIDARLSDLTTKEIWEAFHRRMTDINRQWWIDQGIPVEWQDYLKLGFLPDKEYYNNGGDICHSPSYTIPYFHGDTLKTIQYRLTQPDNPSDKYRFEVGLPSAYFDTTPTIPMCRNVIVCEGAKKAIVTRIKGSLKGEFSVLAVPGKSSWGGIQKALALAKKVFICLDPDGTKEAYKLATEIGKEKTRVIELSAKIDDAFLFYGLDAGAWKQYLDMAVCP